MMKSSTALQLCCGFPGCPLPANERVQLTAYTDPADNQDVLCFMHQAEADDYWRERWEDYYAGLGV